VRLVLIGVVAGILSALFGVGGGIVIVPLLVLLAGFEQRPAMATSLAAIAFTALAGTIAYAARGEVKPGAALIVGIPATLGAVIGTTLQQRLKTRPLSLAFAGLLVAAAIRLLV
jgi:uncharacterized protein